MRRPPARRLEAAEQQIRPIIDERGGGAAHAALKELGLDLSTVNAEALARFERLAATWPEDQPMPIEMLLAIVE